MTKFVDSEMNDDIREKNQEIYILKQANAAANQIIGQEADKATVLYVRIRELSAHNSVLRDVDSEYAVENSRLKERLHKTVFLLRQVDHINRYNAVPGGQPECGQGCIRCAFARLEATCPLL